MSQTAVSSLTNDGLIVPVKAATVYAAHENSLFLSGNLIPVVNAPNGVLQVPEVGAVTAETIDAAGDTPAADLSILTPGNTKNTINCALFGASSVVRDLGNIDPQEIGRSLGNAVAKAADLDAIKTMANNTTEQEISSGNLDLDEIFKAVGTIRANGEMGQLYGVVAASEYGNLMSSIGSTAYAGGDFQTEALRSGFVGSIAGVQMFVSSYLTDANVSLSSHNVKAIIFGQDAYRIAMQANVNVEVGRRPAAVGFDCVASLHMKTGAIDANRSVMIKDES